MASKITPYINQRNLKNVQELVQRKHHSTPFHATLEQSAGVLTDYDTHPYPRWFKGVYNSSSPIFAEREAGWRPRHDSCYRVNEPPTISEPTSGYCFEGPCSLVVPCYPEYLQKIADRDALNVILNRKCISQYR